MSRIDRAEKYGEKRQTVKHVQHPSQQHKRA